MGFVDYTWVATITGNVIAEVWGAGGGGRQSDGGIAAGGGGGGGAYSRRAAIAVILGNGYLARVANTSPSGTDGDTSLFINGTVCSAVGGDGSPPLSHGAGGLAGSGFGDVKFSGGDGGGDPVLSVTPLPGFGGGSSASDVSNGVAGLLTVGGVDGVRSGKGGNGGPPFAVGTPGSGPGGGGGGGGSGGAIMLGGIGGRGAVVIWEDMGVWPPVGQTPIGTFGSPPVDQAKARKSARFM